MSSKTKTVLLMRLLTVFALAFMAPAAVAQTFGVSLNTSGDVSAASGLQLPHPMTTLTIQVRFEQAVVLTANDVQVSGYGSNGDFIPGVSLSGISPATAATNIYLSITVTAATTEVRLQIAGGIASADPFNDATSAALNTDIDLESSNPVGGPTVYEISRVGLAVPITTAAEFQVKIVLSEAPSGGCTPALINVSGADVRSIQALVPEPATASRPATWRDGMLHGCAVTLATRPGQNSVVISVNSFSGLGGQTYTPPTNLVAGVHTLTVGSQRAEIVRSGGHVVNIPAGKRILDYLVIATNIAASGVQKPDDSDANPPLAHKRTPAQMRYNVIEVPLPNLRTFLEAGGRIDLVGSGTLTISEIMWGGAPNSQWMEIKNNSGRHIVTGANTHRLIFYGANETPPASRVGIADRVGTLNAAGVYWQLTGKGRSSPTQAISMYRVGSGLDGTLAAAWGQSTLPALNFDPNRVGNRIGTPGADPLGAPAQPTPVTTPGTTPQTPQGTTPAPVGQPSRIEIDGAAQRTGAVDQQLETPLRVRVLDANGTGVPNTRVTFRVTTKKGSFSSRRNLYTSIVATDASGYAAANFTPKAKGTATVLANVQGVAESVSFTIRTGETTPDPPETTPATTPKTTQGTTPETTPKTTPAPVDPPARTTVSPVVHVGASKRLPMLWVDGGKIYGLIGADVKIFIAGVDNAMSVAVDGEKVYWTAQVSETRGTVNSANLDGTGAKPLQADPLWGVPIGIAVDSAGSKLYWTDAVGRLQQSNLDGSGIQNVLRDLPEPMDIALSDGKAYWTQGNGSVRFANLTGTKNIQNISTDAESAGSLVITDEKVYWTEKTGENTGTVNSANLDGTGAKQLIAIDAVPMGIAVDTERSSLYWTDSTGRIQSANLDGSVIQDVVDGLVRPGDMLLNDSLTTPAATPPPSATPAADAKYDLNADGTVNNQDARLLFEAIIRNESADATYDVNNDGVLDFHDLLLVFDNREAGAAGAPTHLGMKLTALEIERLQEQIDLLIATNDRSPAAMRTLIYLQQLLATARPEKTQLLANYPNPFNPETWIPYQLATDTEVRITIYNAQGVVIRTLQLGQQLAGYYTDRERAAYWDGRNALGEQVASGIYFYQLETDTMSTMRKMVILK